jgi:hypothetical protein
MNISTVFRTVARIATANSISGTVPPVPVGSAAATAHEPSTKKPRRLARCLATAAATVGLIAVGSTPANADILDPWGGTIVTTVYCDLSTDTVKLKSSINTTATVTLHLHNPWTGDQVIEALNLAPTPDPHQGASYTFTSFIPGTSKYSVYYAYSWPEGTAGEWASNYAYPGGTPTGACEV